MNKNNILCKWKRILTVAGGSMLMGISINLFVRADFGLDPLSLFQAGLAKILHTSLGNASILLMLSIIIVLFFADRKRIGIGTIINSLLVGTFVNLSSRILCAGTPGFTDRVISLILGLLLMGVGIGIYVSAQIGEAGIDAMMVYVSRKVKKSVNITRVVIDILLSAAGFYLCGKLGIATVISMLINGYIIQLTIRTISKWKGETNGFIKRSDAY